MYTCRSASVTTGWRVLNLARLFTLWWRFWICYSNAVVLHEQRACPLSPVCSRYGGPNRSGFFLQCNITVYLHYITLHYITLHYITLHYITLRYVTLRYTTLHSMPKLCAPAGQRVSPCSRWLHLHLPSQWLRLTSPACLWRRRPERVWLRSRARFDGCCNGVAAGCLFWHADILLGDSWQASQQRASCLMIHDWV